MRGAYSSMTHHINRSLHRESRVGNGFCAIANQGGVEVVCGRIETLFSYLSIKDVAHLYNLFDENIYQGYNKLLSGTNSNREHATTQPQ